MWNDLFAAIALLLVLEGLMPFINPKQWRRYLSLITELNDQTLRIMGLMSMLLGAFLLFAVRSFE